MKVSRNARPAGFALIIVMIVIFVLGILAGGFAYSMKVETRLARNTSFEGDLEWLGRSGVEFARYILVQHLNVNEPWDSLNQKWAGGPMGTNEVLENISLENNQLGAGIFSIKIVDLERKININLINEGNIYVLQQALAMNGVSPGDVSVISDSFLDWIDRDDDPHLSGTESRDYLSNPNPGYAPYLAKNGPIDDLAELLLIRGMTPEIFWGSSGGRGSPPPVSFSAPLNGLDTAAAGAGIADIFTFLSVGGVNLNTASARVLQFVPGLDPVLAQGIVSLRAGWDGVDGTEDDVPFRDPRELINVPGMQDRQFVQRIQGLFQIRSYTFEVTVEAKINQYRRQFVAVLRRNPGAPRDIQTLYFHWK